MSDNSSPGKGGKGLLVPFCFSSFFSGLSASGFFFLRGIPASHLRFLPVGVRRGCCTGVVLLLAGVALFEVVVEEVGSGVELAVFLGLELVGVLLLVVLAVEFFRGRLFTP